MIGIDLIGFNKIKKYLRGKDITWTSEDINNPVYSKKKPLSVELLKEILIKDKLNQGIKNFDKAARIGFGVARLHPTYGIAMNIIDLINEAKKHDPDGNLDFLANENGIVGKVAFNSGMNMWDHSNNYSDNYKNMLKKRHAKIGGPGLVGIGTLLGLPDYILDIKDLYNTITE